MIFFWAYYFAIFISFADLLHDRIEAAYFGPQRKKIRKKWLFLWGGRSRCLSCGEKLNFLKLLPIFGFLWQRGRCSTCGSKINSRHLYQELLFWIYGIVLLSLEPDMLKFLYSLGYVVIAYIIIRLDNKYFIIPTELIFCFLTLSLSEAFFFQRAPVLWGGYVFDNSILKVLSAFIWMLILYLIYRWMPGKLGFADVRLTFALIPALDFPLGLFLPSLSACGAILWRLVEILLARWQQNAGEKLFGPKRIAFGAYLAIVFLLLRVF